MHMSMSFPPYFSFGIADADLQVIGEQSTLDHEGSHPTMWTHAARRSGKVFRNQTPLEGIDRYHRWREDLDLMGELGVRRYRTSVSMARVVRWDGTPNEPALEWYTKFFKEVRARGIEVAATLYHWELPEFLAAYGGWAARETIEFYLRHVELVVSHLGDLIDEYYLVNEPFCIVMLGYLQGVHAPFEKDLKTALRAGHHLLLAQGRGLRKVLEIRPDAKVSTVALLSPTYSATAQPDDMHARYLHEQLNNWWFLDPMYVGQYPSRLARTFAEYMPDIRHGEMEEIRIGNKLHSLGVNYYNGSTVEYDERSLTESRRKEPERALLNGLGWPVYIPPVYQSGLYDALREVYARYQIFGVPRMTVTENGTAWHAERDADGVIRDDFRIAYLEAHLQQVHDAMRAGVPVDGYFLWTLMDNYEWQEGYRPESAFGLVHVDRDTLARTPKASFHWYKRVIESMQCDE
jgi:beta-glucosidase